MRACVCVEEELELVHADREREGAQTKRTVRARIVGHILKYLLERYPSLVSLIIYLLLSTFY